MGSDERLARDMLDLAARIASRSAGLVEPNPLVGAVLVRDGRVIGMGRHRRFGGPHAEREAIADCRKRGHQTRGATMFVTLEPCTHHGKTPPCTDAVVESGVARVVIAQRDPNPEAGGGAQRLERAGVRVEFSAASETALRLNDPFVKRITTGLPWVIAKWAQSIDGRIATRSGESKWISCEASRRRVHRIRSRVDAVLTGIGTVVADDPMLTARMGRRPRRVARRVVVDPQLRIPERCALIRTRSEAPVTVACRADAAEEGSGKAARLRGAGVEVLAMEREWGGEGEDRKLDLRPLLAHLVKEHDATNVLVEAGPGLIGSLLAQGLVDEAMVFVAPRVIGDDGAPGPARMGRLSRLSDAIGMRLVRVRRCGEDAELVFRAGDRDRLQGMVDG